jgi:hypothetical protein
MFKIHVLVETRSGLIRYRDSAALSDKTAEYYDEKVISSRQVSKGIEPLRPNCAISQDVQVVSDLSYQPLPCTDDVSRRLDGYAQERRQVEKVHLNAV